MPKLRTPGYLLAARRHRQLFSTAVLQDQIAECCCVPPPPPTPPPASADLQITATLNVASDPASGVASLLLTMTVSNNGPSTAGNVAVAASVPVLSSPGSLVKAVPASPVVLAANGIQANLGSMTNGQSQNLQCLFVPLIPAGTVFINSHSIIVAVSGLVSADSPDPVSSNNSFNISAVMPFPAQVLSFTGDGKVPVNKAIAIFTKSLQATTVTASTFQIVDATTGNSAGGSVSYDDASRSATYSVPGDGFAAGNYDVTLVGTGAAPILDVDGLALDGDSNGRPGGDYTNKFSITA